MDYVRVNADLHLHGLYSGATSPRMTPATMAEQAALKGLHLLGTGDILNPKWEKLVREELKLAEGNLLKSKNGVRFILQAEVEDSHRVHHLIFFPEFTKVTELRSRFKPKCNNLESDGRPIIDLSGAEIAEACFEAGCLFGPSHAFTPWTSLLKEYDSLKACYKEYAGKASFVELGLSADTDMADMISELHNFTFLSNSDAHSPWPHRLGREFNRLELSELTYEAIEKALAGRGKERIVLNLGLNPLEGKYHKTRCLGCLTFYTLGQARKAAWKCQRCGKPIKKGVAERVSELADLPPGKHPSFRPPYKHIIPLSEIIALALNTDNVYSTKVQDTWKRFVSVFGSEIAVLLDADFHRLARLDEKVANYVRLFREGRISYVPGGAGVYGRLIKPAAESQRLITDF